MSSNQESLAAQLNTLTSQLAQNGNNNINNHEGLSWDHHPLGSCTRSFPDGKTYPGTFYRLEVKQAIDSNNKLAIDMENAKSSKPGTLKIGVNHGNGEILTLARIHKTKNHDFGIFHLKPEGEVLVCQYGVVQTPEGYDQNPHSGLGFPNNPSHFVRRHVNDDDHWIQPNSNLLERSHSPSLTRVSWDHKFLGHAELILKDGSKFNGSFYKLEAKVLDGDSTLAIHMENGKSSKPGTLKIGVNHGNGEILTLARIHKTENHDFYIDPAVVEAVFEGDTLSIKYGVVKTPEGYGENPNDSMGFPDKNGPLIQHNITETDRWVQPDDNLLERSHSPIPPAKLSSM